MRHDSRKPGDGAGMIDRVDEQKRHTGFVCRLRELIGKKEHEIYE